MSEKMCIFVVQKKILLGRFKIGHSLSRLKMEKEKGAKSILLLECLLPVIAELLERIVRLFDSTLDELFEKAIADPETRMVLECILRYNQDLKDRA